MEYFRISKREDALYIFFFNRGGSIYSSKNMPNLLKKLKMDPIEFVENANALFAKYKIVIPDDFPKHSALERKVQDKKVDDFPIHDFMLCIYCCIHIELEHGIDTSKILRRELIQPNSNSGIHHACSMSVLMYKYLMNGYEVTIPLENEDHLNPDLIINNLKCEVKTIQEYDWSKDIDPETGFGEKKKRGQDLCYDIGTFISKEKSGYKGILQGELIFADLTLKSLGEIISDIRGFGHEDKLKYELPEIKKYRIIYFSRFYLDCVCYYIDFEPRLWNLIDIASGFEYQRVIHSFSLPANGKSHEIKLPTPPEDKK